MKMVFSKIIGGEPTIKLTINGEQKDFSYVEMITRLYKNEILESPEFDESFSPQDIESINKMVEGINKEIEEAKDI